MGSHSHGSHAEVRNPGPVQFSGALKGGFAALAAIGVVAFLAALQGDSKRAWFAFIQGHFFFMSLALGGIFFAAIQWLTGAMWSAPVRRVGEAFTAYIPVAIVTFALLYFGLHDLYIWTHPEHVKGDILLEGKAAYLNVPFFMVRNLAVLAALYFLTKKMIGNSIAQDADKNYKHTARNKALAPAFLLVFGVGFTMASFDQLMSLAPHWFSTMFGVYCFAGLFYSFLAALTIAVVLLRRKGVLTGIVNDNHLHDLGKFMFAFTVFWAYIGFSQFMLIWYANLPEETFYFSDRFSGGWFYVSVFLLVGKFMTPFFFLLPRDAKRSEKVLLGVGAWMLLAQWVDLLWIAQPEYSRTGPVVGWQEIGTTLGFAGVFGLMVVRFLSKHNAVAVGDPRLAESVFHHHQ